VLASAVKTKQPFIVADRRYFKNSLTTGRFSSGEYIISRATFKPVFNFGYPLKNARGEVEGIIFVGFDLGYYQRSFAGAKLPAGSNYLLIDHNGVILSGAVDETRYVGKALAPQMLKEMQQAQDEWHGIGRLLGDGEHYVSFRKMHLMGEDSPYMYIRVGIPTSVVLANANRILLSNLALFIPGLLVALYVALLIGKRSIADRISLLKKASKHIAQGERDARVSGLVTGGELGSLGESFDSMANELALGERARLASEKNYQVIFNASKDAIILHDLASGRILEANDAVKQMYGYAKEEILHLTMQEISAEDSPYPLSEAAGTGADPAAPSSTSFEWQCRRKTGEIFWTEVVVSPTTMEGSSLAVVRDITERLEADTEKKQLKDQLYQIQRIESIGRLAGGMGACQ
jgi:PAS domain S-box-containing protein